MNKPRVVVCAANRNEELIICGARHFDAVMRKAVRLLPKDIMPTCSGEWEQGFIDQFGVFMTREEAYDVAEAAGQIKYECGSGTRELFSEHLY